MHHIVYLSQATAPFGDKQLQAMLRQSRQRNTERGITGLLLYGNDQFFQVLEGEPAAIQALYASICRDPRHLDVVTLADQPIARRSFSNWSMAYHLLPPPQFIEFAGYASSASAYTDPAQADEAWQALLHQVAQLTAAN